MMRTLKLALAVPVVPVVWTVLLAATAVQAAAGLAWRWCDPCRRARAYWLVVLLCIACTDEIDRAALAALPTTVTGVYGFTVAVDPAVNVPLGTVGDLLDAEWAGWTYCEQQAFEITPDVTLARSFRYEITPTEFKCRWHESYCGGEYSFVAPRTIILAYHTPADDEGKGPLAYAWHEWSDIYQPGTENQEGRPCTHDL